jgi:hypothetical protein
VVAALGEPQSAGAAATFWECAPLVIAQRVTRRFARTSIPR